MKNCIPRKYLCGVLATVAVAFARPGIAGAQVALPQSTAFTHNSVEDSMILDEISSAPSPSASLPDAPVPQQPSSDQTHINAIPLLSPRLVSGTSLTARDKWEIYYHKTYSPAAVVFPLVGAGFQMTNPKNGYPREWKDGMGAFGRVYGNTIAERTARSTADFATQVVFHEDPRYQRSESKNPVWRVGHALAWTFVDSSDSGHRTFAASTFTSAAVGGFVGMAYLPDGYNDVTHAEQRMLSGISGRAIGNVVTEFEPVWGPWAAKLHVPKLLPAWWVSQPKQ